MAKFTIHPDAETNPQAKQMKKMFQTNANGTDTFMWDQGDDSSNLKGSIRYGAGKDCSNGNA